MPNSAPFQLSDYAFKDTLEGNRHSGGFYLANPADTSAASALLQARNPTDGYVVVNAEAVASKQYDTVQVITDPDVTDTGTQVQSRNRRLDGPPPDSTLFQSPSYTDGTGEAGAAYPLRVVDAQDQRKIPPFIVPHDTDVVIQLAGAAQQFGIIVNWSEVTNAIVPKIN